MANGAVVVTDNLEEVLTAFNGAVEAALVEIGSKAQGYAKDITPVRTGVLRDSIGFEVKGDEKAVYIGTIAEKFPEDQYGKYVELGSRGSKGVHMLQRAASEHKDEYKSLLEDSMKNA